MKSLLMKYISALRPHKLNTPSKVQQVVGDTFLATVDYPLQVDIKIVIIKFDLLTKYYAVNVNVFSTLTANFCTRSALLCIENHIRERVFKEKCRYLYHLETINMLTTLSYSDIGLADTEQKVLSKHIKNSRHFEEYLELVLFGAPEPFIEKLDDLYD